MLLHGGSTEFTPNSEYSSGYLAVKLSCVFVVVLATDKAGVVESGVSPWWVVVLVILAVIFISLIVIYIVIRFCCCRGDIYQRMQTPSLHEQFAPNSEYQ